MSVNAPESLLQKAEYLYKYEEYSKCASYIDESWIKLSDYALERSHESVILKLATLQTRCHKKLSSLRALIDKCRQEIKSDSSQLIKYFVMALAFEDLNLIRKALKIYQLGLRKSSCSSFEAVSVFELEIKCIMKTRMQKIDLEISVNKKKRDPLTFMPYDVVNIILSQLTTIDLLTIRGVSRTWKSVVENDARLWTVLEFQNIRSMSYRSLFTCLQLAANNNPGTNISIQSLPSALHLPKALQLLPVRLTSLTLSYKNYKESYHRHLLKLAQCNCLVKSLKSLSFESYNRLGLSNAVLESWCSAFSQLTELKVVVNPGGTTSSQTSICFPSSLEQLVLRAPPNLMETELLLDPQMDLPNLKGLRIDGSFSDSIWHRFANMTSSMPHLQKIYLIPNSRPSMSVNATVTLHESVTEAAICCPMQDLRFRGSPNKLRSLIFKTALSANVIGRLPRSLKNLEMLSVPQDQHPEHVLQLCENSSNLTRLFAAGVQFNNEHIIQLAELCPKLEAIDISYSQVSDRGIAYLIARANIKRLRCDACKLGFEVIDYIRLKGIRSILN